MGTVTILATVTQDPLSEGYTGAVFGYGADWDALQGTKTSATLKNNSSTIQIESQYNSGLGRYELSRGFFTFTDLSDFKDALDAGNNILTARLSFYVTLKDVHTINNRGGIALYQGTYSNAYFTGSDFREFSTYFGKVDLISTSSNGWINIYFNQDGLDYLVTQANASASAKLCIRTYEDYYDLAPLSSLYPITQVTYIRGNTGTYVNYKPRLVITYDTTAIAFKPKVMVFN